MAVVKDIENGRFRKFVLGFSGVPYPIIQRIEAEYTTETERNCAFVQWWLNTNPSPTWMDLALVLYKVGRDRALEKVAQYLPKGTHMENVQTGLLILCSLVLA